MTKDNEKEQPPRLTVTLQPDLLAAVRSHRAELCQRTGLKISTSAAVSALVRSALEATRTTSEH